MAVIEQQAPIQGLPLWPWGYAAASVVAIAAVLVAPLAVYVFTIAVLGIPHVVCELRYCDQRFSARAPRSAVLAIGVLLIGIAGLRIAQGADALGARIAVPVELFAGVALTAAALWFMPRRRLLGAAIGCAITVGAVYAPISTFLVFAWLHNLSPLGFFAEVLGRRERRSTLIALLVPFILVPAVIASGVLQGAMRDWLGYSVATGPSLFGAGRSVLGAYLNGGAFSAALPLFSAAVAAQVMHYFSVIVVMPQILQRQAGAEVAPSLVRWPSWRSLYIGLAAFGVAMGAFNAIDYATARKVYGVAAAIHSWLELPIFLIALGAGFGAVTPIGARPATS